MEMDSFNFRHDIGLKHFIFMVNGTSLNSNDASLFEGESQGSIIITNSDNE